MSKPGRNDPCYCGSGKKYKQCHLQIDAAQEHENSANRPRRPAFYAWNCLDFARDERFVADFEQGIALLLEQLLRCANTRRDERV